MDWLFCKIFPFPAGSSCLFKTSGWIEDKRIYKNGHPYRVLRLDKGARFSLKGFGKLSLENTSFQQPYFRLEPGLIIVYDLR